MACSLQTLGEKNNSVLHIYAITALRIVLTFIYFRDASAKDLETRIAPPEQRLHSIVSKSRHGLSADTSDRFRVVALKLTRRCFQSLSR